VPPLAPLMGLAPLLELAQLVELAPALGIGPPLDSAPLLGLAPLEVVAHIRGAPRLRSPPPHVKPLARQTAPRLWPAHLAPAMVADGVGDPRSHTSYQAKQHGRGRARIGGSCILSPLGELRWPTAAIGRTPRFHWGS